MTTKQFFKKTGIELEERDGKFYFSGYLYLEGTAITSLPDNLTVGGYLDLRGTAITDEIKLNRNAPTIYFWKNRKYIKCDGIFSIVVACKGNVYHIRQIGCDKACYLVTDGSGRWAHGDTLIEARKDLIYKISVVINQDIKT